MNNWVDLKVNKSCVNFAGIWSGNGLETVNLNSSLNWNFLCRLHLVWDLCEYFESQKIKNAMLKYARRQTFEAKFRQKQNWVKSCRILKTEYVRSFLHEADHFTFKMQFLAKYLTEWEVKDSMDSTLREECAKPCFTGIKFSIAKLQHLEVNPSHTVHRTAAETRRTSRFLRDFVVNWGPECEAFQGRFSQRDVAQFCNTKT